MLSVRSLPLLSSAARACLLLALVATGCGRKATESDCQKIVRRVVELEMAKLAPDGNVAAEVKATQEALKQRAQKLCVGRRVTESSLRCVDEAKSAQELIDDCFN